MGISFEMIGLSLSGFFLDATHIQTDLVKRRVVAKLACCAISDALNEIAEAML